MHPHFDIILAIGKYDREYTLFEVTGIDTFQVVNNFPLIFRREFHISGFVDDNRMNA